MGPENPPVVNHWCRWSIEDYHGINCCLIPTIQSSWSYKIKIIKSFKTLPCSTESWSCVNTAWRSSAQHRNSSYVFKTKHRHQVWDFHPGLSHSLLLSFFPSAVSCADTIQRLWSVRAVRLFILYRGEKKKVHHKPVTCCRGLARGAAYPPQQERSGAHRNDRHMTDLSARAARAQTHSRTRSNACFPSARNFRAKRSDGRAQPAWLFVRSSAVVRH